MIREVKRHIERAMSGIRLAFRGTLPRTNSAQPIQLSQVAGLADELLQDVELMQHYGFTSHPPAGSECVVLPLGGRNGHGIVIATEHGSYRLQNLQPGEVALYSDEGDSVILKRGRVMEVVTQTLNITAGVAVNITSPLLTLTGTFVAQGDVMDHGIKSMAGMRMVYNGHTHSDPQGGSVTAPGAQM